MSPLKLAVFVPTTNSGGPFTGHLLSLFQNLTFKHSNESNSSESQWHARQRARQVRPVSASCRRKAADPWKGLPRKRHPSPLTGPVV